MCLLLGAVFGDVRHDSQQLKPIQLHSDDYSTFYHHGCLVCAAFSSTSSSHLSLDYQRHILVDVGIILR